MSLRPGSKDAKSRDTVKDKRKGGDTDGQDAGSVAGAQAAVKALDTSKAQVGEPNLVLVSEQCSNCPVQDLLCPQVGFCLHLPPKDVLMILADQKHTCTECVTHGQHVCYSSERAPEHDSGGRV